MIEETSHEETSFGETETQLETRDRAAHVRVVGTSLLVTVPISSSDKPDIPEAVRTKWQEITNLAARIIGVPAGLIMRLMDSEIEVYTRSMTENNPYETGERAELGTGLYCETVVGRRRELLVPYALDDPEWAENPDVELDMNSYLGLPILWPDGEVFGTLCVLDNKHNTYSDDKRLLMRHLCALVESDLAHLLIVDDAALRAEIARKELRHRIKNQFNLLLSYIDLHAFDEGADREDLAPSLRRRINTLASIHD